jgi:hypothetical protein
VLQSETLNLSGSRGKVPGNTYEKRRNNNNNNNNKKKKKKQYWLKYFEDTNRENKEFMKI